MSGVCVSVFISQDDAGSIHIRSIAQDDAVSKTLELMLCQSAANVIKFVDAQVSTMEQIKQAQGPLFDPSVGPPAPVEKSA
ncbi:MAG: hypothetical protein KGN77_05095 [Xanthomonadaceae bacterium]|nr:hypothetical protein [Xanthomonadaceae bacterium]